MRGLLWDLGGEVNELALFSGTGGCILGARLAGHKVIAAVENEPYCIEVLLRRQEDGSLDPFPVWDDIRSFNGKPWNGIVDVVSAGFPCQPFSKAGLRAGTDDERNLWPEVARIIGEVRPRYVFLENVPAVVQHLGGVLSGDLARLGYNAEWGVISARDAGAPHIRKRWWCVAHSNGERLEGQRVLSQCARK